MNVKRTGVHRRISDTRIKFEIVPGIAPGINYFSVCHSIEFGMQLQLFYRISAPARARASAVNSGVIIISCSAVSAVDRRNEIKQLSGATEFIKVSVSLLDDISSQPAFPSARQIARRGTRLRRDTRAARR